MNNVPRLIVTKRAAKGLERCRKFLAEKNEIAARRAAGEIGAHFKFLNQNREIGRPLDDMPELRELLIPFGGAGYICLYRYERHENAIYILAFRHQREAGYH